jgi:hypothetical protein
MLFDFLLRFLLSFYVYKKKQIIYLFFILGVYRRTPKDVHPMQSASNNSKQQLPTGTDTGRSSSARATKK